LQCGAAELSAGQGAARLGRPAHAPQLRRRGEPDAPARAARVVSCAALSPQGSHPAAVRHTHRRHSLAWNVARNGYRPGSDAVLAVVIIHPGVGAEDLEEGALGTDLVEGVPDEGVA